ncbi:hypothetical protein DRQ17_06675, partial [bacterium]
GTAADYTVGQQRVSDVAGVKIAYKGLGPTNTNYWNQTDWTGTSPKWFDAAYSKATDIWVEDNENPFDNVVLPADGDYQVIIQAYDEAGNYDTTYTTVTFTWDRTPPTFSNVTPSTGSTIRTMDVTVKLGEEMEVGPTKIIYYAQSGWNGETVNSSYTAVLNASQCADTTTVQSIPQSQFDGTLIDGNIYKLVITGDDLAGNQDNGSWYWSNIIFDLTEPDADFTYPYKYYHSSMTVISGTAVDDPVVDGAYASDVDHNEIKITRDPNGTPSYWDGSKWQGTIYWLVCSGTTTWTYNVSVSTAFVHDVEYRVDIVAVDKSGNKQSTSSNYVFKIDTNTPQGAITSITDGGYYKTMTDISGTATDDLSDIEATGVLIQIKKDVAPIQYWDGTGWNNDPQWVVASYNSGSWSYSSGPDGSASGLGAHPDGTTYKVTAKITDKAGNVYNTPTLTFYNDITQPSAGISNIENDGYYNSSTLTDIDGTASDGTAGVKKVEIVVREENVYWDGNSWGANVTWLTVYSTTTPSYQVWHATGINWVDGIEHHIWMRVEDEAGNIKLYNHTSQTDIENDLNYYIKFKYDETEPESYVSFPNNNTYYNVKYGTFTGTASDPSPGTGVSYVRVRIQRASDGKWWRNTYWGDSYEMTASFAAPNWEFYIASADRNTFYENSEEKYLIYSQAEDFAGNKETLTAKCTFYYDVVEPTTSVKLPATTGSNEYYTTGDAIDSMLWGEFYDGWSGISRIDIKISSGSYYWTGSSWTTTEQWTNSPADIWASSWTYTSLPSWQNGAVYTITSRAEDNAGNVESSPPSNQFTYDTSEPYSFVTTPVDGSGYESMNTISGTAGDDLSGVDYVRVIIQENFGDFRYYDIANSTWKATVVYNTTTFNAGSWSCNTANVPWQDDKEYKIQAKAYDKVGIAESVINDGSQAIFHFYKKATSLEIEKSDGNPFPTETTAGNVIPIRVVAKNEDGEPAKWYQGTVEFSCSDGTTYNQVPDSYTFTTADAGIHYFLGDVSSTTLKLVVRNAAGWVKVEDVANSLVKQKNIDIKWAGAYPDGKFTVSGINSPATAGDAETALVKIYDGKWGSLGNIVEDYEGTISFSCDDSSASLPSNYTFTTDDAGQKSFSNIVFKTAIYSGGWTLTVTDVSTPTITGSQTGILVNPGSLDHFEVYGLPDPFTAGDSTDVIVEVFDAYGNRKTDYTGTIIFDTDDPLYPSSAKLPSNYTFTTSGASPDKGIHEFHAVEGDSVTLCTAGTRKVWVKDSVYTLKRGTQTLTVEPTYASSFVVSVSTNVTAGVAQDVYVRAVDTYGNKQPNYTGANAYVTFESDNGNYTTLGSGEVTDGERTFTGWITLKEASDPDTVRYYVTVKDADGYPDNKNTLIQGSQTGIKVNPASASKLDLTFTNSVTAGSPETANVKIRDDYDNIVYSWSGIVTFHTNDTDNSAKVEAEVVPSTQSLSGGIGNYSVIFYSAGTGRELWVYSGS